MSISELDIRAFAQDEIEQIRAEVENCEACDAEGFPADGGPSLATPCANGCRSLIENAERIEASHA